MKAVAVYNMKGGVGKTTTAVNLSYLAAAAGKRVLLWDLDPQAASSFAFRVQPRVEGFGKKSLETGQTLSAAIKETDYGNLDLLPADFAYRKFDRLLSCLGKPERVMRALLDVVGRDYDAVFLDCPPGFSLLTEGVLAEVDCVLVPTIPTVLSLRTVARLIKWTDRSDARLELAAFFSMVDRRKALHRRACEWSAGWQELFLAGQIPYASVVEQMAVRRMPLAAFAAKDPASIAFAGIWAELQARLQRHEEKRPRSRESRACLLQAVAALIMQLQLGNEHAPAASQQSPRVGVSEHGGTLERSSIQGPDLPAVASDSGTGSAFDQDPSETEEIHFIHRFDTDRRDLQRLGYLLELRERPGSLLLVATRFDDGSNADTSGCVQAPIDKGWAAEILWGAMSPLTALEQRLGSALPSLLTDLRVIVGRRRLVRVDSGVARHALQPSSSGLQRHTVHTPHGFSNLQPAA